MFSYPPFHTHLFNRQPCAQCGEVGSNKTEFLRILDLVEFCFISHPALGQREGREHERIMYFHPETETVQKQTEITGVAEALVNFTQNVTTAPEAETSDSSPDDYNYRYITSKNTKEVILVLEGGAFLMGISLIRKKCTEQDYFPHMPTIKVILAKAYETFRLFYGSFSSRLAANLASFKGYLTQFFTPYFASFRVNKIPLVDLFTGVDFMPLANVNYLEVECLMTRCTNEFPSIKKAIFLYQERLILYTVEKRDLIAIYNFLTKTLIPFALQNELQPEIARRVKKVEGHTGFFLTEVADYLGELSANALPQLYLSNEAAEADGENPADYYLYELITYRALNATICFFVQFEDATDDLCKFLENLAEFLDQPVCELASKIGEIFGEIPKAVQSDIPFHFVYFNPDSLSLRTSFSSALSSQASSSVPPTSIYRLVYDTYDRFVTDSGMLGQIFVKADNDWWVVFKRVKGRVLALFIQQTTLSSIVDVQECVSDIVRTHFDNIFLP